MRTVNVYLAGTTKKNRYTPRWSVLVDCRMPSAASIDVDLYIRYDRVALIGYHSSQPAGGGLRLQFARQAHKYQDATGR